MANEATIRVVVIDDHPHLRQGVCQEIDAHSDMEVTHDVSRVEAVPMPARSRKHTDVVVLDLSLRDGVTGTANVAAVVGWGLTVIVHTEHSNEAIRDRCFALGASGFVGKSAGLDELPRVIRTAAAGRRSESGVERLNIGAPLTDREVELLAHLTSATSTALLAEEMSYSKSYVDNLISNLLTTTGLATRADLAVWAQKNRFDLLR